MWMMARMFSVVAIQALQSRTCQTICFLTEQSPLRIIWGTGTTASLLQRPLQRTISFVMSSQTFLKLNSSLIGVIALAEGALQCSGQRHKRSQKRSGFFFFFFCCHCGALVIGIECVCLIHVAFKMLFIMMQVYISLTIGYVFCRLQRSCTSLTLLPTPTSLTCPRQITVLFTSISFFVE